MSQVVAMVACWDGIPKVGKLVGTKVVTLDNSAVEKMA